MDVKLERDDRADPGTGGETGKEARDVRVFIQNEWILTSKSLFLKM